MRSTRISRPWQTRVAVGALSGLLACASGCVSSHELPAPLSPAEKALVERSRLNLVAGMERKSAPDRADATLALEALRRAGIFKTVAFLDQLKSPPDVVVRGDQIVDGTPAIPIFTLASLGLIPTRVQERWGFYYSFRSPHSEAETVEIEASHRGATVLGWVCRRLNKTPGWTDATPNESQRMYDRLALAIAEEASEIRRVAAAGPPIGPHVRHAKADFMVIASLGTHAECIIVPTYTTFPKTYSKVYGPAPGALCKAWVAKHNCRSDLPAPPR